jgi:hypothetical protein
VSDITILCVTRAEPYALEFLTDMAGLASDLAAPLYVGVDGDEAARRLNGLDSEHVFTLRSHGYIESVLDEAVAECPPGWILRLDDDERVSHAMYEWLLEREYRMSDHWAFPRANLWPNEHMRLAGSADGYPEGGTLWPDLQTRLSSKEKSGGRTRIHVGSPYGTGAVAPVAIEHYKFLRRSFEERTRQARRYESVQEGAGSGNYLAFQTPEVGSWPFVAYLQAVVA